tara:strand:- start:132168 stop:134264 length:2097 start_codon:yes stop_codon:yes gene_type:complete
MPKTRVLRLLATVAGIGGCMVVAVGLLAIVLDHTYPPPLPDQRPLSAEVLDRDGQLLRVFAAGDGRWRMKAELADIDPEFIDLLIAYEDKRFWTHHGVDPLAMARAFRQMATSGHIVSGGSTITMQLARLLEPRVSRTLAAKMRQIARALQLERRLTKRQILEWYLTLAPYGGNLEGTRAASLSYFGAEPSSLTLSQAALLVALPQSPEMRRPDRHPIAARQAGLRVLQRAASSGLIDPAEVQRVAGRDVTVRRRALPALAAHLAQRAHQNEPDERRLQTSLLRDVQANLEVVARDAAERLGERLSVAIVMADSRDGSILGQVGSANFFDGRRFGWIDMTRAQRSPGSTLKPLIYGLAFGEGLVLPETLIADRPTDFSGYRPRNFDLNFQGDVSIRRALQLSLNVPAIRLLQAVGPARLTALLREAGVDYAMPSQDSAGLSIGLGGLGISLLDLVQVYTSLATVDGRSAVLTNGVDLPTGTAPANPLLQNAARWHLGDILRGIAAPAQSLQLDIAYKTGTSYGYRDAWSVGYDGRYVIGVWIGRADNSAVPGLTGLSAAAPVLFEAFARSGIDLVPFRAAPPGAVRIARADLPESMRRFERFEDTFQQHAAGESKPHIAYPPDGARIELSRGSGQKFDPLVLKLQGGRPPFRWLANGSPVEQWVRQRNWQWMPDGRGSATLAVIDASGQTANVNIVVD